MASASGRRTRWSIGLALVVATVGVYAPVRHHAFINLDDNEYVYENAVVREGLTAYGLRWAFTTAHFPYWHPLTWISHMTDVELFGLEAGGHHVVSAMLHALDALLLFLVLAAATGAVWRSGFVAAVFALHPLHVESVAWIAERKDVLSTAFALLTIGAYVRYAKSPSAARYAVVALAFALGLLSKPMLVTLPFVLLLLDAWPLRRWGLATEGGADAANRPSPWRLVVEKIPLLGLAAVASVLTVVIQARNDAVGSLDVYPVGVRIANATVSYVRYLAKTAWPTSLAVFYPHPTAVGETIPALHVALAAAALAGLTALVLVRLRAQPYLAVGWFWYLGTLVPVSGVLQAGSQALADRFTYVPMIGILIAVTWGAADALAPLRHGRRVLAALAGAAVVALSAVTVVQVRYWRDPETLLRHAIAVTDKNMLAWNNLGMLHLERGAAAEALECFRNAIASQGTYADAWYNAGVALAALNQHPEAIRAYREAVELESRNADGWGNLAVEHQLLGEHVKAIEHARTALRLRPDDPVALSVLVISQGALGDRPAALAALRRLQAVAPDRATEIATSLAAQR